MPGALVNLLITAAVAAVALLLLAPRRGLLARWRKHRLMTDRVLSEDALKHVHKMEIRGRTPSLESIAGALGIGLNETAELVRRMQEAGLLAVGSSGAIGPSPQGRQAALHIIRAHRLWERYLAEETGYAEEEWHERAERAEHALSADAAEVLDVALGHPSYDPHGDPIPATTADPVRPRGQPLAELEAGAIARIVHVEDEPPIVYAQLLAARLHPGQIVRLIESSPERIRIWAGGDEQVLAPVVAANLSVIPIERSADEKGEGHRLSSLELGQSGEVLGISGACRGGERRRFLDLGILPGTVIAPELRSPAGGPTAYRVRGALIALRAEQADHVQVRPMEQDEGE